jgi:hypothetical protein
MDYKISKMVFYWISVANFANGNFNQHSYLCKRESFNAKMPTACFLLLPRVASSWASRIPIIKEALSINEAQLGTLLLLMPIGHFPQ